VRILVIGYGNTLRRDDAAGVKAAEAVQSLGLPDVEILVTHQLNPELAEELAQVDVAIFLDAGAGCERNPVSVKEVTPRSGATSIAHTGDPGYLLYLSKLAYGAAPKAWMVTIAATDFALGEGLTGPTAGAVAEATDIVQRICRTGTFQGNDLPASTAHNPSR